jgi:hypothetical protein
MISPAVRRAVSGLRPSRPQHRRFSSDEACAQAMADLRPWQRVHPPYRQGDAGSWRPGGGQRPHPLAGG